jgi:hypothetical protein
VENPFARGPRNRHHESLVGYDPKLISDMPTVEFSAELGALGSAVILSVLGAD